MNCLGSAAMQKGLPNDANEYSDEGTAAHLLGSTCLETGKNTEEFRGLKINVGEGVDFDGAVWESSCSPSDALVKIRRTYTVDDDMIEAVGRYVDRVRQYAEGADLLMPEQRISIASYTGEKDAAGTSDAAVVLRGELQVHDLKYGMGVRVDAKENKQLMIYALGVREELDLAYGPFERIRIVIHQPRLEHLSEWDCTAAELDAFGEEVKKAADVALELYYQDMSPDNLDADLRPSTDACRWCKAKPTCPALAKYVADATAMDFTAVDAGPQAPADEPAILSQKMAACGLIEDWIKAVRAKVEQQLFAGVAIPGWKIVQGKKGNRSWRDAEAAEALFKEMRMTYEERYKMTLLSPTQIEKSLKATPKRLARVQKADLVEQKEGKPSVAPESDPRPVWTPPDSTDDFSAVNQGEVK